jgi:hypothetical protein
MEVFMCGGKSRLCCLSAWALIVVLPGCRDIDAGNIKDYSGPEEDIGVGLAENPQADANTRTDTHSCKDLACKGKQDIGLGGLSTPDSSRAILRIDGNYHLEVNEFFSLAPLEKEMVIRAPSCDDLNLTNWDDRSSLAGGNLDISHQPELMQWGYLTGAPFYDRQHYTWKGPLVSLDGLGDLTDLSLCREKTSKAGINNVGQSETGRAESNKQVGQTATTD